MSLSITPGDRVILWGENSAAWIAVFFGCLLRGVLVVPLDAVASIFAPLLGLDGVLRSCRRSKRGTIATFAATLR